MDSRSIRAKFLKFFEDKGHKIVPSAPIVVQNDPTLMFTNAGMNQFKDFFLGNARATDLRVSDTQKCLRVSGKHNDLEEVGFDTYHHTMFEMLGNWSFGDYFKKEAIAWAWELLTKELGIPEDRLYATVFEGSEEDDLSLDEESQTLWGNYLPVERILLGDKKDNFWEMGDSGPCGPCSEIHMDLRADEDRKAVPGKDLVNKDHPEVVEIWNLVFIQFNRMQNGVLKNLPAQHVDTGMGFERLTMALQGKKSSYDTDLFQPLIKQVAQRAGISYGDGEKTDIALRVIADHVRAIAFTIADGQLPSNNKAGYVIRRILRRAVRYGYTFLNFKTPFLFELVTLLSDQFEEVFPELKQQQDFVSKVIQEEEVTFLRTLENGLKRLDQIDSKSTAEVSGETAFELYDTYGFPLDLTALIAKEKGMSIDIQGFDKAMEGQKERSKNAAKQESGDWIELLPETDHSEFVGYDLQETPVQLVKYRSVQLRDKNSFQLVFDRTPFYAESGGQVGDTGYIDDGNKKIAILDTQKENELIVHFAKELPVDGKSLIARVSQKRRRLTQNNHTGTHLLHAALREVLGDHVQQRGSLVNEKLLRFDFSHFSKMTEEEIEQVQDIVNERIRQNISLDEKRNVPLAKARAMGAMALFGEKYGDFVRVITFDPTFSVELCGGTHVSQTGQIGFFKIISEGSVAAGVRRIEAITANAAEQHIKEQERILEDIKQQLKSPKNPSQAIAELMNERQSMKKELEQLQNEKLLRIKDSLKEQIANHGAFNLLVSHLEGSNAEGVKSISFQLKQEFENLIQLYGVNVSGKPQLSLMIDEGLVKAFDLDAPTIVRTIAKSIKGGGGGQAFYATAGGKEIAGLSQALEQGKAIILEKTSS